jgi:tetratricopeptide (TPR) repeat protein
MARLVRDYGVDVVAHHFIPVNAGPQHQVSLLGDLTARLILTHDLTHFSATGGNPALLRDTFIRVLNELGTRQRQAIVVIDGLDQLADDDTGARDLSFLPPTLPSGVVLVLSTRPNDVLRDLSSLALRNQYVVPPLSRSDFELLLARRGVTISGVLADRFYDVVQQNALYLDLVSRELAVSPSRDPEEVIRHVSDDPNAIFSFAIGAGGRLSRWRDWERVGLPLLRLLLVATQPLSEQTLQIVMHVPLTVVKHGVQRLGGLILRDTTGRCSLYHLKLAAYLRREIFSPTEVSETHAALAAWCVDGPGGLAALWADPLDNSVERERRLYARVAYTTHLYHAHQWAQLWATVDNSAYVEAQLQNDPSGSVYARDLDLARHAVMQSSVTFEEGVCLLPALWHYSWTHCQLAGRADVYPLAVLETMVLLHSSQEAIGLTELLTDKERKAQAFRRIGMRLARQAGHELAGMQVLLRATEVAWELADETKRVNVLNDVVTDLASIQQFQEALHIAETIQPVWQRSVALTHVAGACADIGEWQAAYDIAHRIENIEQRIECLCQLSMRRVQAGEPQQGQMLVDIARALLESADVPFARLGALRALAVALHHLDQNGEAITILDEASKLIQTITRPTSHASALHGLAVAWDAIEQRERALAALAEAELLLDVDDPGSALAFPLDLILSTYTQMEAIEHVVARAARITNDRARAFALRAVALACLPRGDWEQAITTARTINDMWLRANTLLIITGELAERAQLEQAEVVAYSIDNNELRAEAVGTAAAAFAGLGETQRAQALVRNALAIGNEHSRTWKRTSILPIVSDALVQAGCWEQALAVAQAIDTPRQRGNSVARLVTALLKSQQWDAATTAVKAVEDAQVLAEVVGQFAAALALAGHGEQAIHLANTIPAIFPLIDARPLLVGALARSGYWQEAADLARLPLLPDLRAPALLAVAEALIEGGDQPSALSILEAAEAEAHTIIRPDRRAEALCAIAVAEWRIGLQAEPQVLLHNAALAAGEIEEVSRRVEGLVAIARAYHLLSQQKPTSDLLTAAINVVLSMKNSKQHSQMLHLITSALVESGDVEQAISLAHSAADGWLLAETLRTVAVYSDAQHAFALANAIEHDYWRTYALGRITSALDLVEPSESSVALVDDIIAALVANPNRWARDEVLSEIAELVLPHQLDRAVAAAYQVGDPWRRAKLLATIIKHAVTAHSTMLDQPLVDAAIAAATETSAPWQRVEAFGAVADALHHAGQTSAARRYASAAVGAVDEIMEIDTRMRVLRALVEVIRRVMGDVALLQVCQQQWLRAATAVQLIHLLPLMAGLLSQRPDVRAEMTVVVRRTLIGE